MTADEKRAKDRELWVKVAMWIESAPTIPDRDLSDVVDGGGVFYEIAPLLYARERLIGLTERFGESVLGNERHSALHALNALMYYIDPYAGKTKSPRRSNPNREEPS